jgi:hypothetical protein
VPVQNTDVFIYANTPYSPVIKDTALCNHLTLANDARLTVSGTLLVKGKIIAAGATLDARKATLLFNGLLPQTIPAGDFIERSLERLIINNTAGVSLQEPLFITGTVLLNSGSFVTNDLLTLKHTANIGPSATGTFITGNISIEHFIKGGRRAFRLLGHPFANDIALSMIKDSIDITGAGGSVNGFTNTATNQPSAFRYDPSKGNDSSGIEAGWAAFTHINGLGENGWKEYNGIKLFVRGRPGQGLDGTPAGDGHNGTYLPAPVTFIASGAVHTGEKELLLKAGPGTYHLIANPYPSSIDMSLLSCGNDIAPHYWLWDPQQGDNGGYSSIPFHSKNILPPFGAFIVKETGSVNATLLFTENCKVNDMAADTLATVRDDDAYFIELRLETGSIFRDRLILFAKDSARSGIDRFDAEKFPNPDINFYSLSREQKMLSIDTRPIDNGSTIPLGLQANAQGPFSIRVAKLSLASSNSLMLHDKFLGSWMKLETDSSYHFSITADTLSKGNGRFEITTPKKATPATAFKMTVKLSPVPATDKIMVDFFSPESGNTTIRLIDLNGIVLKNMNLGYRKEGQETLLLGNLVKGVYLVEVRCGDKIATQKLIKN